jgi:hypothetical protein
LAARRPLQDGAMVSSVNNNALLNYLSAQGAGSASTTTGKTAGGSKTGTPAISQEALQRAAGMAKSATAIQALEASQKTLSSDLRAAMQKAGVKLTGTIEFAVKSDGSVEIKGSDADRTATKAFLKADAGQPSFAMRIASQARDALKLSATLQQSAAISQAARHARTSGGVMSLYTSLMQQSVGATAVYSVSATSSSLTYPGSLAANA